MLVTPAAVMVSVPVRLPAAVGANVTLTVHERAGGQAGAAGVGLAEVAGDVLTVVTGAAAVPVLVTVTVCAALVVPVACEPKPSALGLTETLDPLSGRYGGNVGSATCRQAGDPKMPELPPPSVRVKPTPQL